jgi:sterol desaturase/sphingolipid hydroxylase (fatty acid hydroxylase superfamily)
MQTRLSVIVMLAVVFTTSGLSMPALAWLATCERARRGRRRVDKPNARISGADHRRSVLANSIVSAGLIIGVTLGFSSRLFAPQPVGALRVLGQAAAILAIYDFAYYLFHRFALHAWSLGRRIHAVHHSIRTPYANDSLYVHPAETAGGATIFLVAAILVGPVSVLSFAIALLVYSLLNIWIHSAIDLPYVPLSGLVRHHDIHHESMKAGYYASITPLWDLVFGTARRTASLE